MSEDTKPCAHCKHKATPRSQDMKTDVDRRINRAIGQLNGIKSMVDEDRYCGDVLTQLAAVNAAIKSISAIVLQDHMETCVVEQVREGHTEVVDEVVALLKKFS